jgi:phosphonate transport system substrate-binding protein
MLRNVLRNVLRNSFPWNAAALLLSASVTTAAAQVPEINFGVLSTEASMNQKKNWEPFLQAIAKSTGYKINGFYATDYAGVIEAMRFNKVHLAWFGNKSGIEAVDRAGAEVFGQVVARDGNIGYYSHIIVHRDSPFAKLDDILKCDKSLDFGNGDPNSTSGFLVPMSYIFAAHNIDPKSCFKTVRNANHQANAMASPLIPLDPLVWRKDLDPGVKAKLYTFLMSYGHVGTGDEIKAAKEVLANLIWSPFHPSSDNQLLSTRKLEANKDLLKVKGDAKLSDDEKAKEIVAIQGLVAKLAELEKKAEADPFRGRVAAFIEAEKAGRQDDMKRLIAEFAAIYAHTN